MIRSFVFILRVFFHNNLPDNTSVVSVTVWGGDTIILNLHNGYICQEFSLMKKKIRIYLHTYKLSLDLLNITQLIYYK